MNDGSPSYAAGVLARIYEGYRQRGLFYVVLIAVNETVGLVPAVIRWVGRKSAPVARPVAVLLYPLWLLLYRILAFGGDLGIRLGLFEPASLRDIREGIGNWHLWGRMGLWEVRRRYRRTIFGPFWATLNMGIFIAALGLLYARLWGVDVASYLPYLCTGFLAWIPISTIIAESANVFVAAGGILTQMRQPYSLFVCALVCRNILVFFHHLVIFVIVIALFPVDLNFYTLLAIPGLFLISLNAIWVAFLLGALCARYRDIQPLITNVLQILMFVTPIFYPATALGPRGQLMADVNPFFHFVEIVRTPLLGQSPSTLTWTFVLCCTVLGWLATLLFMSRYRRRICYWL